MRMLHSSQQGIYLCERHAYKPEKEVVREEAFPRTNDDDHKVVDVGARDAGGLILNVEQRSI